MGDFPVGKQLVSFQAHRWGWGMVLINHKALWVVISVWMWILKQAAEAQILFSIYEDRKVVHGSCVDESCRRMDGNAPLRQLSSRWHSQQMEKLQVTLLIKRPFKIPHLRGDCGWDCSTFSTSKVWYWNQRLIKDEGSLDKQGRFS